MKPGDRVQSMTSGQVGTCFGPVFQHGVWWMRVKWDRGGNAIVLEEYLEVVNENRR